MSPSVAIVSPSLFCRDEAPGATDAGRPEPALTSVRRISLRPLRNFANSAGLRFCLRVCLWQLPTQQLSQICRRATHSHVEMPEQRVHCADFVKSHLVNQFLEHQRIVRPQIYSPLPIVEADRSRNNLLHLARVSPPPQPLLGHLSPAFFNWGSEE